MREVEGQGGAREARDAALVSSKRRLSVCLSACVSACPQRRPARTSGTPDEPHTPLGPPPPETAYEAQAPPNSSPSSQETPETNTPVLKDRLLIFPFFVNDSTNMPSNSYPLPSL